MVRAALRAAEAASRDLAPTQAAVISSSESQARGLAELAHTIVPRDDSALQWSEVFSGLTSDPAATFERLLNRLVLRYQEKQQPPKKSDDQVWRTFSRALEGRNLVSHLQEHQIQAKVETVRFKHALKNGKWHLMEPVSFDLGSHESITDKAKRLLGQMSLLKSHSSEFRMYFLVGEPEEIEVQEGYQKALQILEEIPCDKRIYPESMADDFAAELERVASH